MSHHHTYYVTSSYILGWCARIHTHMPDPRAHTHTWCFVWFTCLCVCRWNTHTYYVTSSYILCHIIIHTMPHHHTRPNHQPQAYPSWTSGPGCEATRPQARRAAAPIHAKKKSKRLGSPSRVRLDNGSLACVCVCVCVHTFIYTYTYIHDRFEGVYMYMYMYI